MHPDILKALKSAHSELMKMDTSTFLARLDEVKDGIVARALSGRHWDSTNLAGESCNLEDASPTIDS